MTTAPIPLLYYRPRSHSGITLRLFANRVPAGFPSPADDYVERSIDLNDWLIKNKLATFIVEVEGDSMTGEIHHGDRLIVDRSLDPHHGDIVVACVDGEVTVKRLVFAEGKQLLVPENPAYPVIELSGEQDFFIWGVVTHAIHKVR
jgi:DNA polymerase V